MLKLILFLVAVPAFLADSAVQVPGSEDDYDNLSDWNAPNVTIIDNLFYKLDLKLYNPPSTDNMTFMMRVNTARWPASNATSAVCAFTLRIYYPSGSWRQAKATIVTDASGFVDTGSSSISLYYYDTSSSPSSDSCTDNDYFSQAQSPEVLMSIGLNNSGISYGLGSCNDTWSNWEQLDLFEGDTTIYKVAFIMNMYDHKSADYIKPEFRFGNEYEEEDDKEEHGEEERDEEEDDEEEDDEEEGDDCSWDSDFQAYKCYVSGSGRMAGGMVLTAISAVFVAM